jgi:hypothetical protein
MTVRANSTKPGFKIREEFSFHFGAAILCLGGYRDSRAFCPQPALDSLSPARLGPTSSMQGDAGPPPFRGLDQAKWR